VDEQAFRFNSRKVSDGMRFMEALGNVTGRRFMYKTSDWQGRTATAALIRPRQGRGARGKLRTVDNDGKPDKPELSPFERFREFARRIIAVPKAEIEKQEGAYQRQKARKRLKANIKTK